MHRDVGYLAAGLTVVYAVSGLALNHVSDWNPNYEIRHETVAFAEPAAATTARPGSDAWARAVLESLGVASAYRGTFRPEPGTVEIFVDGGTVAVALGEGRATLELVRPRPLLRPANFLHLNEARRLWTWMADLYAAALLLLVLTGLLVLKGRTGITGRGAWLTGVGVALPLLFLALYF